jgi:hypothetical protein
MMFIPLSMAGCLLPPAAWTSHGYTKDVSHSKAGASVAGHCFRLLADVGVARFDRPYREESTRGEAFDISGRVYIADDERKSAGYTRIDLPEGSKIVVEKVLRWSNVESSHLTPYIRIDDAWIEARDLFEYAWNPFRLTYIDRLLAPCDDG